MQPTHASFGDVFAPEANDPVAGWLAELPQLETDSHVLGEVAESDGARPDRAADRGAIRGRDDPAAGRRPAVVPDPVRPGHAASRAYQTVAFGPGSPAARCWRWPRFQGKERDDFRDEEPGKILHELRQGELTQLGLKPHSPYYGTRRLDPAVADPAVRVLALDRRRRRWSARSRDNALAALDWIDEYGDRDGDGYVEYQTRSSQGLGNQCWRDSFDGVQFADGTIPFLPIATCELQGYVYDAKLRLAELADGPFADAALADPAARPRRRPCASGSSATSGSRRAAATTRSGSTATSDRSTR